MTEEEQVLVANEAFYRAFASRDVGAMDEAWARAAPVACLHPGWGPLVERAKIMESWRGILTGPNAPDIRCIAPRVFLVGGVAFVVCFEEVERAYLVATNIFTREGQDWKMIHHQAAPTGAAPRRAEPAPAPRSKLVH